MNRDDHVALKSRAPNPDDDWRLRLTTPVPSAGVGAYKREKWLALGTSPRRLLNYIRYKRASRDSSEVSYVPVKLDIENVSRCNFRCTMCQVSGWKNLKRADDMPFEGFKHLIDHQYGLVEIKIQGMGEPTLGGETYFRMIEYARKKHIWVRTITNASMLHLRDIYKKMIDSGVNEVQISIDGATKETFEKIRVGSKFERVVANCKLINEYSREKGVNVTKMWTVVQRDNLPELPALLELGHEMGFKDMVFSLDVMDWGQEKWNRTNSAVRVNHVFNSELADQLMKRSDELGVRLGFWTINAKYSTASPEKLCPWPFERAFISSDLRIVPCCMLANPDVADLGDARKFTAEWNGATYREFREAHLQGHIPKVCKACYLGGNDAAPQIPVQISADSGSD